MDELRREVGLLMSRAGHWGPPRWAVLARDGGGATRAELVYALVQRLADRAADVEGQPRRPVPRLDNDLALLDQLRVVTTDLAAADPDPAVVNAAAADLAATRRAL